MISSDGSNSSRKVLIERVDHSIEEPKRVPEETKQSERASALPTRHRLVASHGQKELKDIFKKKDCALSPTNESENNNNSRPFFPSANARSPIEEEPSSALKKNNS